MHLYNGMQLIYCSKSGLNFILGFNFSIVQDQVRVLELCVDSHVIGLVFDFYVSLKYRYEMVESLAIFVPMRYSASIFFQQKVASSCDL